MDRHSRVFLDICTLDAVSGLVGDARPAWVWSQDGRRILWANAAGAAFFRASSMTSLLERTLPDNAPARLHLERVARNGASDRDTVGRLRFFVGPQAIQLTTLARRIHLPDGAHGDEFNGEHDGVNGALVVAVDSKTKLESQPLDALCQLLAGETRAAFIIGPDAGKNGAVFAKAGDLPPPKPTNIVPDAVDEDGSEDGGAMSATAEINGTHHAARIAHLGDDADADFLLIVNTQAIPAAKTESRSAASGIHLADTTASLKALEVVDTHSVDEEILPEQAQAEIMEETEPVAAAVAGDTGKQRVTRSRTVATSRFPKNFFPWRRLVQANEPAIAPVVAEGSANENGNRASAPAAAPTDPALEERMIAEAMAAKQALLDEDTLCEHEAETPANGALKNGAAHAFNEPDLEAKPDLATALEEVSQNDEAVASLDTPHLVELDAADDETIADDGFGGVEAENAAVEPVSPLDAAVPATAEVNDETSNEYAGEAARFIFVSNASPVRFVWQMDVERRFISVSNELAQVLGAEATDIVGQTWDEVADRLDIDHDGKIAASLRRRDTWSGLTVNWPVTDNPVVVPVDLAALPAFDRDRAFEGYRGFGVCRPSDAITMATAMPQIDADEDATAAQPAATLAGHAENGATDASVDEPAVAAPAEASDLVEPAVFAEQPENAEADETVEPIETLGTAIADEQATADDAPDLADSGQPTDVTTLVDQPEPVGEPLIPPAVPGLYASVAQMSVTADNDGDDPIVFGLPEAANADVWQAPVDTTDTEELPNSEASLSTIEGLHIGAEFIETETLKAKPTSISPFDVTEAAAENAENDAKADIGAPAGVTPLLPFTAPAPIATDKPTATPDDEADSESFAETVIRLAERRSIPPESQLSKPEREAFRKIAEALGSRIDETNKKSPSSAADTAMTPDEASAETLTDVPVVEAAAPALVDEPSQEAIVEAVEAVPDEVVRAAEVAAPNSSESTDETAEDLDERHNAPIPLPIAPRPTAGRPVVVDETPVDTAARAADVSIDPRLLDRLPIGVAIVRERDVVYANITLLKMLGYPDIEKLTEAGGLEAVFAEPEEWPTVAGPDEEVERTLRVQLSDGSLRPVDAHMHTVPWCGGRGLMISLRDKRDPSRETAIDRLHETKTMLARAEDRVTEMDAILDTATDGVLVLTTDGRILQANRSAQALFGAEKSDLVGASLTDYLAPESHRSALDYLDSLSVNGVASVLNDGREVIGQISGGGLMPLFMTVGRIASTVDGSDDTVKFCAVLRDITQWKKAEEELTRAKRQAENASSQKSDFLAKISHEIRTPLNAIIGFSEVMIGERFGEIGNERYKDYLNDIHNSGSHLLSLVNDLLDLSKVEAGKLDLSFEAVPVNDLIGECVALMQPQANRERIIIRTSLPTSVPEIVADKRSLRQIILNLLSNAIKFNQPGGQVIVSTALEPDGVVVLRVRDTGIGMSEKDIKAALEPFRQLHTARLGGGTGLGLPLTKALVEANRAQFSIDSTPNQGTLIEITYPSQRVLAE